MGKNLEKNKLIGEKGKATREKRKGQVCKVFELKVDKSQMNKKIIEQLLLLFLESKWLYNYTLSQEDFFKVDYRIKEVEVKIKDKFEKREIKTLGSQIRQGVLEQLKQNILSLSKSKKKGNKVGKLKYITSYNCINLSQFSSEGKTGTFRFKGNGIKIQGIKQYLRVNDLKQIEGYEIANAKFIQKAGDYYFHVTCYMDKEKFEQKKQKENIKKNKIQQPKIFSVGTDFGIKNQLTLSNGVEIKYCIEPPKGLRKLHRKLSKKQYRSNNWWKAKTKLEKKYQYHTNKKEDTKNKIIHIINDNFTNVMYQNDCMKGWQRIWGKRILYTSIGGIIAEFRNSATATEVDRFFASTKTCHNCYHKQNVGLDERIYKCESCKTETPRDLNSAIIIEKEGLKKIGMEYAELTPVEKRTSTLMLEKFNAIPTVKASLLVDAGSLCLSR
ncbi:MAG TPA: transposase [Bacteroidia bacterium]|nr:transposase [Bacteroidia bacterium]